ncbi:MAG: Fe-S cluster assembly protein SufD [Candidatus Glassbacteria bacterium]|nr:Fe-S cluster assembly protein SufD [Candidatus Glassbacteria bacterium]
MITTVAKNDEVEALAAAGPAWLGELRRHAWERHQGFDYPQPRDEYWRYTDLSLLRLDHYRLPGLQEGSPVEELPAGAGEAFELQSTGSSGGVVSFDGTLFSANLSLEAERAGVVFTDFETAAAEHGQILRTHLAALVGAEDIFTSWNLALHRGGVFLYVPPGVHLEAPLTALHWLGAQGAAVPLRNLVVVGQGASVVFNDVYASGPLEQPSLVNPVTELFIGPEARVGFIDWQKWGPGVRGLARVKARLAEGSRLETLSATLGGDFSRTWTECLLAGRGAESIMLGLYFSRRQQKFEHWTVQDHAAPDTRSDLLYKGALDDSSRAVYYGTIRVRHEARGTDAYQANRNLTLSPGAKADTNPQLEIETNDVRCTHGATVGRVSDEQLFYLMSRGIERSEAERLLVFGFFNEVLERVEFSGLRDSLTRAVEEKLEARE